MIFKISWNFFKIITKEKSTFILSKFSKVLAKRRINELNREFCVHFRIQKTFRSLEVYQCNYLHVNSFHLILNLVFSEILRHIEILTDVWIVLTVPSALSVFDASRFVSLFQMNILRLFPSMEKLIQKI